jgi:hypothetical protein
VPLVPVPPVPVPLAPVLLVPVPVVEAPVVEVPVVLDEPGIVTAVTPEKGTESLPTLRTGPLEVSWTPVTIPETGLPDASVPATCWPSIDVAALDCWAPTRLVMSVERALSCWTSSKSAVSERNWVGSVGLSGSWFSSWEMRSFKKVSELTPFNVLVLAVPPPATAVSPAGSCAVGCCVVVPVPAAEISLMGSQPHVE